MVPVPGGDPTEFHRLDNFILQKLAGYRSPSLNQVMLELSALGSRSVIAVVTLAIFLLLGYFRDFRGSLYLGLVLVGATFWPELLKNIYGRARPEITESIAAYSGLSFPSGHSFGASAVYFGAALLASRYLVRPRDEALVFFFAGVLVITVGITRIYLGVHYPSDVVAGICAGGAWSFALAALFTTKKKT